MAEFDVLAEFIVLSIAILIFIFLVLFFVRFYQVKKAFEDHRETILDGLRSCSSEDEVSTYLKTLSFDDIKFICDSYGFDINNFIIKR